MNETAGRPIIEPNPMQAPLRTGWKDVAWNGIRFTAPCTWEISRIGADYLMLEEGSVPRLELKWKRVGGKFSHAEQLRRLCRGYPKKSVFRVREGPLPERWREALASYQATGFAWQGNAMGGQGAILYCAECARVTLIQFYQKFSGEAEETSLNLLGSLRDHRNDGQVLWCAFDIRATVPKLFRLDAHRFDAGCYRLDFEARGQKLTLHRWGPASLLLGDRGLKRFSADNFNLCETAMNTGRMNQFDAVHWESPAPARLWRLKIRPSFRWIKVWHVTGKNRILGVAAEAGRPLDCRLLNKICSGYEAL